LACRTLQSTICILIILSSLFFKDSFWNENNGYNVQRIILKVDFVPFKYTLKSLYTTYNTTEQDAPKVIKVIIIFKKIHGLTYLFPTSVSVPHIVKLSSVNIFKTLGQ
jgi:hypothetical protein